MPPGSKRQVAAGGGWEIGQRRTDLKQRGTPRRSGRLAEQEIDTEDARSETADDILARSPPPDKPENMSKATRKTGMFWAPLLSGSTQEEKILINQELAAAGMREYREHYHPQYGKTRINDPGNLNRMHFFEGQEPGEKLVVAGIPDEPMNLDPPGAGGPFDALKYPEALVARLNRVSNDPNGLPQGWNDEALKKIPFHVLANLRAETLAALPESFRSSLPRKILARDKRERPQRPEQALASRLASGSQRLSAVEDMTPIEHLEEPPISQLSQPVSSRLSSRSYPRELSTWDTTDSLMRPLTLTTWDMKEDPARLITPAIGNLYGRSQLSPSEGEGPLIGDMGEPLTSSLIPTMSRWQSRSKGLLRKESETSAESHEESSASPILAAVRKSGHRGQRLPHGEYKMTMKDSGDPTCPMDPPASRPFRESQHLSFLSEDISDIPDQRAASEERCPRDYRTTCPPISGIPSAPSLAYDYRDLRGLELSQQLPAAKKRGRGKPSHACDYCKVKKLRCNKIKSSCASCENSGVRCSFADQNPQSSHEDGGEEQTQDPRLGQLGDSKEELLAAAGHDVLDDAPAPVPQVEDRGFATAGKSGLAMDASETGDDNIDFGPLYRPFRSFGVSQEATGRFFQKSPMDHLALSKTTPVPLKFHPKPVFSQMPHFPKRTRARTAHAYSEMRTPQEEIFMARPSVRIVVPDHLKNLLVDDWENVTKSLLVVPLPSKAPVNFIIDSYFDEEKGKRRLGSAEADVLEEFVAGMKVYFDKAIGKTLLYKFERPQWAEIRQLWESGKYPEWNGKGPGDAYGAEHLCRMLVNMPEMVAQTNMDVQSVNRLREEISRLCTWLARNSGRFFCAKYEKPTAEYIEGAR